MTIAQLYCQASCVACEGVTHLLDDRGVAVEVHDVTSDAQALKTVVAFGFSSLPVLVAPDGTSAAGAEATELAKRLIQAEAENLESCGVPDERRLR